jgi:hypothetical protein
MDDVTVVWDDAAVQDWIDTSPGFRAAMDRITAQVTVAMKAAIPVSPVCAVYARPASHGGVAALPLRPSGYLRNSVRADRLPGGDVKIGPTADYAIYVQEDTVPRLIVSHGPWPLRSHCTGKVFGRVVRHPGTTGKHFIEKAAAAVDGTRIDV